MSGHRIRRFWFTVILFLAMLVPGACNMPSKATPTQDNPGLIHTIAAQTIEAQLTQDAASGQPADPGQANQGPGQEAPSQTPSLTIPASATNTQVPPSTFTPVPPSPTNTPIPCDHISWGKDITIPDGTQMVPGETFTKIWRLRNTGSCTWTSGYALVFESGDAMGAPVAIQLTTGIVAPGQEIDVSVVLVAPDTAGAYQGNFKLRNPSGIVFGLGNDSTPFWVKIVVPEVSGVMFDFLARADDANWGSGVTPVNYSGPGHTALTFNGPITATGRIYTNSSPVLEGGGGSGIVLVTQPLQTNGYVIGRYPAYKVGAGDKLKGRIGFLAQADGSCGAGNAVFQVKYTEGDDVGTMASLGEWHETCDGNLTKIEIDLTALKGKTVRFYLIVLANGAWEGDLATWASFGVMR